MWKHTSSKYGTGIVVAQKENIITVKYPDETVKMVLGHVLKTPLWPVFENNDEVWATFAQYVSAKNNLEKLQKRRDVHSKELEALENGE